MEPVDLLAEMKNMKASMEELRTERLGEAKIMPVPIPNSILPVQESSIHFLACFSLEKESSRATSRVGYHLQCVYDVSIFLHDLLHLFSFWHQSAVEGLVLPSMSLKMNYHDYERPSNNHVFET